MTKTAQPRYHKTQSGEWVVVGPASLVRPGATVHVRKADGAIKTEIIASVGREFDGQVYGYLGRSTPSAARPAARRSSCPTGGDCWSFAHIKHCHECGK